MAAKVFEVGDVLPATTQLRLTVDFSDMPKNEIYDFETTSSYLIGWARYVESPGCSVSINGSDVDPVSGGGLIYIYVLDISSLTETQRTVVRVNGGYWTWEDLNASSGYTITFNSHGGTTIPDIEEATELPTPLPIPIKSGYTFVAWYYESNFQTRANAGDTIEANTTLYAKWHNLGSLFTEIADAIRSKDGTSGTIRDVDFGERVKQIQGPKEEETKTVTPNFSSGNEVVTPTSGKVMTQVTINKDSNLIADNIKKDITVHGITGTLQPAKEEQTKTVSPTTSSQDVLPDANKVLSKVTVNAIPTETKSQQPNLSSGDQTINATSGKFMTSFTITKDTINHIASNIRSGKTLYGVTGNLQPAKEEETKTVTPNFSSGNFIVTPTPGKVMTQVTINKDTTNHIAENIKDGITLYGVSGNLVSGGGVSPLGFGKITFYIFADYNPSTPQYSFNGGTTWATVSLGTAIKSPSNFNTYTVQIDIPTDATSVKIKDIDYTMSWGVVHISEGKEGTYNSIVSFLAKSSSIVTATKQANNWNKNAIVAFFGNHDS